MGSPLTITQKFEIDKRIGESYAAQDFLSEFVVGPSGSVKYAHAVRSLQRNR